jgi:N-methylhydantoinase A
VHGYTVVVDESGVTTVANAFSAPPDFADGIRESLAVAANEIVRSLEERLGETWLFLPGSTVAENAIADGRLDPVGLITTNGFRDTLFATRGGSGRWSGLQ